MRKQLMIALSGLALAATACGSTAADPPKVNPSPATTAVAPVAPVAPTTAIPAGATPGSDVAVKLATSPYGQILVDAQGRTLYAFLNDVHFQSTCTGTCAEAWPPVIVDADWNVAPGLDSGIFSTTVRADDAHEQLMIGRYPLYYFSGDAKPGDSNGQGSGKVWFVVDKTATVIDPTLDQSLFSTVARPDGQQQLKIGKWPMYHFSGDAATGDLNGQGSGTSWFVIGPDGKLIKS
jgi:predicted lipoprotein with Yx(FWY)xxD motif